MTKRFLAASMAVLGLAASAVATAPAASADVRCAITGITPTTVVVGLTPVTRTFNVRTSDCYKAGWSIQLGRLGEGFMYDSDPQYTFQPYSNSEAGPKSVIAEANNADYDTTRASWANGFYLKRNMTWQTKSFNASPEPVRKGKPITIKGRLLIADWTADRYVAARSVRNVRVEFRTPTGKYATVKTVTTNSTGWVSTKVTAKKTGVWRLVYGGNSKAGAAVTSGDSVKVN